MDSATREKWLSDTRRFWDADSEFVARYRRICSSPEFDATTDEAELQALWESETEQALEWILDGIPIGVDWRCLEIGCGIGRLLKPIATRCREAIGVDLSENMCRWSREYLADRPNARVILNDGTSLDTIEDASVDFVYSHLAFQHITLYEVVELYLSEIARVLRPGGYCRIQNWRDAPKPLVQSFKDMIRTLLGIEKPGVANRWIWSEGKEVKFGGVTYAPRQWRRVLSKHGLVPVSIEVGERHAYWMWSTCIRSARHQGHA